MRSIESYTEEDINSVETGESSEQNEVDPRKSESIKNYWKQYGFPGNPPKAGSIAEKRLIDACAEYAEYFVSMSMSSFGDSKAIAHGSDAKRRELHNNIAIMITGNQRSGMDNVLAKKLADFAAHLTYGDSFENVIKEYESYK
jgi:hypothetical protein